MNRRSAHEPAPGRGGRGHLGVLPFVGDEAAFVAAVRERHAGAMVAFYDRFAGHVERILRRLLGVDQELTDVHHDVFERAWRGIVTLRDPAALHGWVTAVTVLTARSHLRRQARRRWFAFLVPPEELPAVAGPVRSADADEAVRATYAVLDRLPVEERVVFALRHVEGMELTRSRPRRDAPSRP